MFGAHPMCLEGVSEMHDSRDNGAKYYHAAEKAYVDPNSFIPERWSTKPELVKDKDAFFPFSLGTSLCLSFFCLLALTYHPT